MPNRRSSEDLQLAAVRELRQKGATPLFLAFRVRSMHVDVASGNIEVGMRIFGFWKSGLEYPEGTVLRQKHGEIPRELDIHIPDIQVLGKTVRSDETELDREVKFHHLTIEGEDGQTYETDTMMTVFQTRTIEEIFNLHEFPFDEQQLDLQVRLPKSNAKDFHFGFQVSNTLHCEKERIRPMRRKSLHARGSRWTLGAAAAKVVEESHGHGPLELSYNVRTLLSLQWTILSCDLLAGPNLSPPSHDRAVISLRLRRKHEYYLARMLVPSGVCASLSMTAWNVEHHAFGERAAILVTLFLALVASTTSYAVNLPKLPYLTALDRYLSMCLFFTTLVTIGCVLGTPRGEEANEHKQMGGGEGADDFSALLDKSAMVVLTIGWVGYNLWYFLPTLLEDAAIEPEGLATLGRSYQKLPGRSSAAVPVDHSAGTAPAGAIPVPEQL